MLDMDRPAVATVGDWPRRMRWPRVTAIAGAVVAYALIAAVCRPLTDGALFAVGAAGLPLLCRGVWRRPRATCPVAMHSIAVWLSIGVVAGIYELGLRLGPNDVNHPTLSTLADPVLGTYPGRVGGYLLWIGFGVWLVTR